MERVATRPQKGPDAIVNPGRPLPPRLSNAGAGVHGGSDILSSGANYGSAQANAYKNSAAYRKAVVDTFLHQDDPQKTAIVQGALKHPSFEGNVVLAAIKSEAKALGTKPNLMAGTGRHMGPSKNILEALGHVFAPSRVFGSSGTNSKGGGVAISSIGNPVPFGGLKGAEQIGKGAISDAVNLGPNTIQGLYTIGKDVSQGKFGAAAGAVFDPIVHTVTHLGESVYHHPLNTLMILGGPEAAAGRFAGSVARSGALGDVAKVAADRTRAPLRLGPDIAGAPSPLEEARSYSPNVITKSAQVAREKALRKRGIDPNVARPAPRALPKWIANSINAGLEAKTRRIPDEMTAMRQSEGRDRRGEAISSTLKLRPHKTVRNIASFIQKGIIRTPATALEDIQKEIDRLDRAHTGRRTFAMKQNRQQVRDLKIAKQNPDKLHEAFDAVEKKGGLRDLSHETDRFSIEHALIDKNQAERARLLDYAQAHMGAKYDYHGHSPSDKAVEFRGARIHERDSAKAVRDAEKDLAAKRQAEAVVMTRADATRGPVRGRVDIRERAVPRDLGERIFKVQRARAAAEDKLRASKATFGEARARRVELQAHAHETMGPGFVHANGDPLKTDEILAHIEKHGGGMREPAYVGNYPQKVAAFRFYQAYKNARGTLAGHKTTGAAFRQGAYDHTYDALIAQAARAAEATTKAGFHDRIVSRLGIKKSPQMFNPKDPTENGYFNAQEAERFAHASAHDDNHNPIPGAQALVPFAARPGKTPLASVAHLQSSSELTHHEGLELDTLKRAIQAAAGQKTGERNIVLVPAHALDQLKQQFEPGKKGFRAVGQVTQQFKRTVLPYSTHWMTQIVSEAALRGLVAGVVDPRNIYAGHQLMKELKRDEAGRGVLRETVNASFYNQHDPLAVHNPNPNPVMEGLRHSPVGVVMKAHNWYADHIGKVIGGLEREARLWGLGKQARLQLQEFTKSYQAGIRIQGRNVELLGAKLRTDPALVAKFGRYIDDTFGKYNKLSPKVRGMVQTVAPFLPWYLNAAKFVLWNLPLKHPVASSLIAATRQTINQDVADGKQVPLNPFEVAALARFTPWGIYPDEPTLGSALNRATDVVFPQFLGAWNVLHGQNVFGTAGLRGPSGYIKAWDTKTVAPAVEAFLEAFLPGLSKVRMALEGGGTPYGTSTILNPQTKPGTSGDLAKVLNKIFNPVHAFQAAGKYTGGSSGGPASSLKDALGPSGAGSLHDALGPGGSSSIQGALGP